MKNTLIIFAICFFMFSPKTTSQVTTNKYELEFDKLLAKKSPEYYDVLINILSQFQENLISNNIIENNNYQSYIRLLNRISEDDKLEFDITYDLKGSLEGHVDGLSKAFSTESSLIAQSYLNIHNSKNFLFSQKVSEMAKNGQELNRSTLANLILEVYNEKDFELPLVKLKIFKFLHASSDFIVYTNYGKPDPN
jgi:hypothetical protein